MRRILARPPSLRQLRPPQPLLPTVLERPPRVVRKPRKGRAQGRRGRIPLHAVLGPGQGGGVQDRRGDARGVEGGLEGRGRRRDADYRGTEGWRRKAKVFHEV